MREFLLLVLALLAAWNVKSHAEDRSPLRLVQAIPMPNVKGRIDHIDVDVKGRRLFVAGLENGSLEVVDLQSGKWLKSIPGFKKTQGIAFVPSLNKLFVGYGGKDAGRDFGEVGIIDAKTDRYLGDIKVEAHPSELLLDQAGKTLFVFVSNASIVQVVDTTRREVVSTWPVSSKRNGDGALDEKSNRLFIGTRTPPEMIAMDYRTGEEVAKLPTVEGMDGVYFDPGLKRIYVSGGRDHDVGYVRVYQQKDADHYESIGRIPTKAGAGTSFWSPELNRFYVAAPAGGNEEASILVFEPEF